MARRFEFKLDTVLRVRELREREARRRVGEKLAQIARVNQAIEDTERTIGAQGMQLLQRQRDGALNVVELTRLRAWIAHLRQVLLGQQALHARLQTELEPLRTSLTTARTQTRVLEKLRERRAAEHRQAVERQEAAEHDDLARDLLRLRYAPAAHETQPNARG